MSETKMGSRIRYLDALRIIAAFGVVVLHVSGKYWDESEVNSPDWMACHIWNAVMRFSVPVFVMISGALFLDKNRPVDIKKLYRNNIFRLMCAFAFWSAIYTVYRGVQEGATLGKAGLFAFFLHGKYHLWFIYMMIGLYVLTPVLKSLNDEMRRYFLKVSFVLGFALPSLMMVFHAAIPVMGSGTAKFLEAFLSAYEVFADTFHLDYIPYYLLGYELCRIPRESIDVKKAAGGLFIGLLITVGFPVFYALKFGTKFDEVYSTYSLNILAVSVCLFLLCRYFCKDMTAGKKDEIGFISDTTFGIYLSHILFLDIADDYLHLFKMGMPMFFTIILLSVVIFIICMLLTALMKLFHIKFVV